jgi:hypothetical protein
MNPYNVTPNLQWPFLAILFAATIALALFAQLHPSTRRFTLPALGAITPLVVIIIVILVRFWRAQPADIWAAPLYYSLRGFTPVLLVSAVLGACLGFSSLPRQQPLRLGVGVLIGIFVIIGGAVLNTFG